MQPQACLDLQYLDCGPHPAQSLQSVCPGMPPLTAVLPCNKGEYLEKGGKINTPSVGYPPLVWALWSRRVFNASKTRQRLSDARFNQTFGRLCVQGQEPPSQRNHLWRKTAGGPFPFWCNRVSGRGGMRTVGSTSEHRGGCT